MVGVWKDVGEAWGLLSSLVVELLDRGKGNTVVSVIVSEILVIAVDIDGLGVLRIVVSVDNIWRLSLLFDKVVFGEVDVVSLLGDNVVDDGILSSSITRGTIFTGDDEAQPILVKILIYFLQIFPAIAYRKIFTSSERIFFLLLSK